MKKKSFLLGLAAGVVLTIVILFVIGKSSRSKGYNRLDNPVSYENKAVASFKVFQPLNDGALATEILGNGYISLEGKVVVIVGENYYDDQEVLVTNPMRIGTYRYENKAGDQRTVPVITGDNIE